MHSEDISWVRWKYSPALSMRDYVDQTVDIRFEFDPVATHSNNGTLRGIFLADIEVARPATIPLYEFDYDDPASCKSRGMITKATVFDEVTGAAANTREFSYFDDHGFLTKEVTTVDRDRSGQAHAFETTYDVYDEFGRLEERTLPHLSGETAATYAYKYRRGAMVGIEVTVDGVARPVLDDDGVNPGIRYYPSGAIHELRFGNGLLGRTTINDASLPSNIEVKDAQLANLFSTGTYDYGGARNIKQIGNDLYRYDAAMRLDWAQVESSTYPTFDLDYVYDLYGNMTDRSVTDGPTTPPPRPSACTSPAGPKPTTGSRIPATTTTTTATC